MFERLDEVLIVDDAVTEYFGSPPSDLNLAPGLRGLTQELSVSVFRLCTEDEAIVKGVTLGKNSSLLAIAALAIEAQDPTSQAYALLRQL